MPTPEVLCSKPECSADNRAMEGSSEVARIRERLEPLKCDRDAMLDLRLRLWDHCSLRVWDLSDDAVITQIAGLIGSGRIHLHPDAPVGPAQAPADQDGGSQKFAHAGVAIAAADAADEPPASAPPPQRRQAAAAPAPPPPDRPIFGDIDEDAQAEALAAAAKEGKPFCPE